MMASFSPFGSDLPSIALIVLHSLEGYVCPVVQCQPDLQIVVNTSLHTVSSTVFRIRVSLQRLS